MRKNDLLVGICDSIGYNGEGILHHLGTTIFVPYCLCGECVEVKILKVKGNIAYAKLERVITPSPDRVTPKCDVFYKCGGCQLQHASADAQDGIRTQTVENCFKKIAGIEVSVDKIVSGENHYGYRNKLQLPIRSINNEVKIGFFREGTHNIVELDSCPIHPRWATELISVLKDFIAQYKVSCYDDETKKGLVRHMVAREINGEFIFTLVINGDSFKAVNGLIGQLLTKFDKFSLYLNVNKTDSNVILGDKFNLVYGKGYIDVEEFGVNYQIGPQSFMQVNEEVKKLLYSHVLSCADVDDDTIVIDGYSGAGVLSAMFAKKAKRVIGVEIVKEAVDAADGLAKSNGLSDKMQNICAPCESVLPDIIKNAKKDGNKVVVILDPPRKGVDKEILLALKENLVDSIIYVACSPQSLARDVGILLGKINPQNGTITDLLPDIYQDYTIKNTVLFNMFPQTKHVESVVCLERRLDVDMRR